MHTLLLVCFFQPLPFDALRLMIAGTATGELLGYLLERQSRATYLQEADAKRRLAEAVERANHEKEREAAAAAAMASATSAAAASAAAAWIHRWPSAVPPAPMLGPTEASSPLPLPKPPAVLDA